MKEIAYFLLQMNTQEDRLAASSLESSLRLLRGPFGFKNAIESLFERFPQRFERDWVRPLLNAIEPFYTQHEYGDYYQNPLEAFLRHTLTTLNDGFELYESDEVRFDLSNLSEAERTAPHMQWCRLLTERYNELASAGHSCGRILRLCQIHPQDQVPDDTALELEALFTERCDSGASINFQQFMKLYIKSRENFSVDNALLTPSVTEAIAVEFKREMDAGVSIERCVDILSRNFSFHWFHRPFLHRHIMQTRSQTIPA